MSRIDLDHAALVARVAERLPARAVRSVVVPGHRPAAVAVLLAGRGGRTHVPFTVRTDDLPTHSGQISFPGGKLDADETFAAAAAREAAEELGIDAAYVRVLGELDDVVTPTGFVIRPVVAELAAACLGYQPNPGEVAEVFEAPLAHFWDPSVREDMGEREYLGRRYRLHAYRYGERRIWGATARIVEQLLESLTG